MLHCRLFEEHSELLNLFTKFHMLKTRDEQAESAELAEHASSVMTSIDEGIRSLDNMDEFHMYVCQIGQKHCKIPGFQKEYFWVSTSTPSVCSLWHSRADKPQTLPHTAHWPVHTSWPPRDSRVENVGHLFPPTEKCFRFRSVPAADIR